VLEERGYVPQNVAGTSAGAIAAALIAAGYSAGALATWWMPSSPTSPATATASR
jgi:predicted acylesterase/phospholipase RssA